ncbi:MAG TPA: glycosyltransferase [Thermomicrobiales bacterium]|nr:glycosyltransferase [Thermomicrobiales bacterium]
MRVLVVLPYGPTRTRVRARMLLEELTRTHQVSIFALAWNDDDREALEAWADRGVSVRITAHTKLAVGRIAITGPTRPLQRLVSTSPMLTQAVRHELASARAVGVPYDAVHIEHLRGAAAVDLLSGLGTRTVLDAVDCIAELARLTREHSTSLAARCLARAEEGPTRRFEAQLVQAVDAVTVVAERDRAALAHGANGATIDVIPNGVTRLPAPVPLTGDPVVIFTGKLSYHANQAAAQRLIDSIWPRVRALLPDAQLRIAGADAPRWLLRQHGAQGIAIHDGPNDLTALIADARVSVAPIVYSVGIQNKVLEAMACGVPVIASPSAMDGLLTAARVALLGADDDVEFARHIVRLLSDVSYARSIGIAGYEYVAAHHSWPSVARAFERLYLAPTWEEKAA